jgi:hypothetical protein
MVDQKNWEKYLEELKEDREEIHDLYYRRYLDNNAPLPSSVINRQAPRDRFKKRPKSDMEELFDLLEEEGV